MPSASPVPEDVSSPLDESLFRQHWREASLIMYRLYTRYLRQLYKIFDGDLTLALVVGEIWQYNIGQHLLRHGLTHADKLGDESQRYQYLPGCNAYSIAMATAIPHQTVRRKVQKLLDMDWVRKDAQGNIVFTLVAEAHFNDHLQFNLEAARDFVEASREFHQFMRQQGTAAGAGRSA